MAFQMDKQTHGIFTGRLDKSGPPVEAVKEHLECCGYETSKLKGTKARTYQERGKHSDKGDLLIRVSHDRSEIVEVKGLSREFTCLEDWPFWKKGARGQKEFIVCSVWGYESKVQIYGRPPLWYFIVNKSKTYAGVVTRQTRDSWYTQEVTDGKCMNEQGEHQVQDMYFCPPELVTWVKLKKKEDYALDDGSKETQTPWSQERINQQPQGQVPPSPSQPGGGRQALQSQPGMFRDGPWGTLVPETSFGEVHGDPGQDEAS